MVFRIGRMIYCICSSSLARERPREQNGGFDTAFLAYSTTVLLARTLARQGAEQPNPQIILRI